jgi:hypothetical protein
MKQEIYKKLTSDIEDDACVMEKQVTEGRKNGYIICFIIVVIILAGIFACLWYEKQKKLDTIFDYCIVHNFLRSSNTEKMEALLRKHPELSKMKSRMHQNRSLLFYASTKEMAELLIKYDANINARDYNGCTPLHFHSYEWDLDAIKIIVSKGADVNAAENKGRSPLHYVADQHVSSLELGNEIAEFLISKGADINARDYQGFTPLALALKVKNKNIADLLRKHGAKE